MDLKLKQKEAARKAVETHRRNLIEKCKYNVKSLIEGYLKALELFEDDYSTDGILAREIGPTPTDSYKRFGDVNNIRPGMVLTWFRKDGFTLDVQAENISARYNVEITPDDIVNFMTEYPFGCGQFPAIENIKLSLQEFKSKVGFNLTHKFAVDYINNNRVRNNNFLDVPF